MTLDPFNAFLYLDPQPGEGGPVIGVKDVIDVAGMPTTAASKVVHRVPAEDAECVARLRAAGRDDRREAEHPRVRLRRAHEQPALRPGAQPVESRPRVRRLERGQRRCRRRRPRRRLPRHGHCRLRAHSRRVLRRDGDAAELGPRLHARRRTDGLVARHGRPARAQAEECERLLETMAGRPLGGQAGDDVRIGVLTSLFERAEPAVATRMRVVRSPSCPVRRSRSHSRSTRRCPPSHSWSCSRRPRTRTCPGCGRGSPTTARTSARGFSRACSCLRLRTRRACAPVAGRVRARAGAWAVRRARRPPRCPSPPHGWTRSRGLSPAAHAVQLAGRSVWGCRP